jgi:hypothetical protein
MLRKVKIELDVLDIAQSAFSPRDGTLFVLVNQSRLLAETLANLA